MTLYRALTGSCWRRSSIPFAVAMARSGLVRNPFEPIFFFGYPVPKIALFPVFTIFIGTPSNRVHLSRMPLSIVVTCYFGSRGRTRLI